MLTFLDHSLPMLYRNDTYRNESASPTNFNTTEECNMSGINNTLINAQETND